LMTKKEFNKGSANMIKVATSLLEVPKIQFRIQTITKISL